MIPNNFLVRALLLLLAISLPLNALDTNEKQNMVQESSADLVIFSYDRPLQLYAYLESLQHYAKNIRQIYVLYRVSSDSFENGYEEVKKDFPFVEFHAQTRQASNDFKSILLKICFDLSTSDYILFGVDDLIITDFFDIHECLSALKKTNSHGFYLRLGKNIYKSFFLPQKTFNLPSFKEITPTILQWDFSTEWRFTYEGDNISDWFFQNSVDMTIFKKADIKQDFFELAYTAPNNFELVWSKRMRKGRSGLCFAASKVVNIPYNSVQDACAPLPDMNYATSEEFLTLFNHNLKIDIKPFYKLMNKSPHESHMPAFIVRK